MAWADPEGGLHDGDPPEGRIEKDGRWYEPDDDRLKPVEGTSKAKLVGWIIVGLVGLAVLAVLNRNNADMQSPTASVAEAACDYLNDTLDPSDTMAAARSVAESLSNELTGAQISQLTSSCESDVDPSLVMGLAGRGPFAAMFTLHEDGPCERGKKFRGTVKASSNLKTASWSVEVELDYASSRITEYTGHAYIDVDPGETMAWDIWLPSDVTTVGSCDASIVSVRPR